MAKPLDGGPAFPATRRELTENSALGGSRAVDVIYPGLSLRDYFAAHALQSIVTAAMTRDEVASILNREEDEGRAKQQVTIAKMAYVFADAMLKARG